MASRFMHDAMHHGQAHARPLADILGGKKGVEDPIQQFLLDAAASVADG